MVCGISGVDLTGSVIRATDFGLYHYTVKNF
jgi:hypothetical protein